MNYAGSSVLKLVNEFNTADQSAEGVAVRINLLFRGDRNHVEKTPAAK
jgi:hypothetical protein